MKYCAASYSVSDSGVHVSAVAELIVAVMEERAVATSSSACAT